MAAKVSALGVVGLAPVRDPNIPNWYGAVGVNVNIPVFNGFLYNSRAKAADLQTEIAKQKFADSRNNIARDVRTSWQQTNQAYERLSVTQQLSEQANLALNLAQSRYNLGIEFDRGIHASRTWQNRSRYREHRRAVSLSLDPNRARLYHRRSEMSLDFGISLES